MDDGAFTDPVPAASRSHYLSIHAVNYHSDMIRSARQSFSVLRLTITLSTTDSHFENNRHAFATACT